MRKALIELAVWLICLAMVIYIAYTYSTRNIEPVGEIVQQSEIITPIAETKPQAEILPHKEYLGEFIVTAYCPCVKCTGRGDGITFSGIKAAEGVTVGADLTRHPIGTKLYIEGIGERVVQDKGNAIKGNRLDLFKISHNSCLEFGKQKLKVWRVK